MLPMYFYGYFSPNTTEILTLDTLSKDIPKSKDGKKLNAVAIKAIDRLGNESDYTARRIK